MGNVLLQGVLCVEGMVLLDRVDAAGEGWGMLLIEAVTVCSQYFCKH